MTDKAQDQLRRSYVPISIETLCPNNFSVQGEGNNAQQWTISTGL